MIVAGRHAKAFCRTLIFGATVVLLLDACQNTGDGGSRTTVAPAAPAAVATIVTPSAVKGRKVALLIGNGAYGRTDSWRPLLKAANDVEAMRGSLEAMGFEVIAAENRTKRGMTEALLELKNKIRTGAPTSVALIYYSGHGMEISGRNYLIPIGASIPAGTNDEVVAHARDEATDLKSILETIGEDAGRSNIVVLDACRVDPAAKGYGAQGKGAEDHGFAPEKNVPQGTVIAYASQPGTTAYEGKENERTSIFTGALSETIGTPGASFQEIMAKTTELVDVRSDKNQTPWVAGNARVQGIVFKAAPPPPVPTVNEDVQACNALASATDPAVFRAYLGRFPNGTCAGYARIKTAEAQPAAVAEAAPLRPAAMAVDPQPAEKGRVFRDRFMDGPGQGPEMVVVPAGSFLMGSPENEPGRDADEGPQHRVAFASSFAAGRYEVTFDEWDACVAGDGCGGYRPDDRGWGRGRRPVINVSWDEAHAYVAWLSKKTGVNYRLLSEAEWEYAARAGTTTPFSTGDRITTDQANFNGHDTYNGSDKGVYRGKTVEVGSFTANSFGLHDMHGNVWEWVEDCWHDAYDNPGRAPMDGSAWTQACTTASRVLRGGSWYNYPQTLRSALRFDSSPVIRDFIFGFRVARTLAP